MALSTPNISTSKRWLVLSLALLTVLVLGVVVTKTGPSSFVAQPLGARRKAPRPDLGHQHPVMDHAEPLRVVVRDDELAESTEQGMIGGEVDYDDYADIQEERESRAKEVEDTELFADTDAVEKGRQAADYEEEDITMEDRDAEEAADYDADDLDETMDDPSVVDKGIAAVEANDDLNVFEDPRLYDLTKARAMEAARQPDGSLAPVVVTFANYHYLDFAMNWVHHLKRTGCKSYLVGAMDDELLKELVERGVPAFGMSSGLPLEDLGWGSATFHKSGREKISLLQLFMRWKLDVVISDVDTVWLRDPLPYMAKYPDADILISSDNLRDTTGGDGGLEHYPAAGAAANVGIMLFRPKAAKFVDHWMDELDKDPKYWDQNAFNDLFRIGLNPGRKDFSDENRLFKAYNETLLMGILPVSTFCSGHTFFVQGMPSKLGVDPYVVHATFQYSGTVGKRNRFREGLLWEDSDSYFQHPVGYIAAQHKVSDRLLDAVRSEKMSRFHIDTTRAHFRLVNQQIETVRALLAIATVTKRAVVMPKLQCGLDRWWAPHSGNIPGSDGPQLPFECPLDHVFDLEVLSQDGLVEWKESSFLENPKAESIKSRTLSVITCNEKSQQCDDGSKQATLLSMTGASSMSSIVKLRAQRTDKEIERALDGIADRYDLIEFDNPAKLWKGFEDHQQNDRFRDRYSRATSIWCCVQPEEGSHVGHIWYDLMGGSGEPHTDRWGRWIDMQGGEWMPQLGP